MCEIRSCIVFLMRYLETKNTETKDDLSLIGFLKEDTYLNAVYAYDSGVYLSDIQKQS